MIVYHTRTGNTKYVIDKLNLPSVNIRECLDITDRFILFTYTDGKGIVPQEVVDFMKRNHKHCIGSIITGNTNFGKNFGIAGDILKDMYRIPIIRKIDLRGKPSDYEYIINVYNSLFNETE